MKAIIIAAGPSKRMRPLTRDIPKCLLRIKGKAIVEQLLESFRGEGISDIAIIRGFKKEKINFPNVTYFENSSYWTNNILHSLLNARQKLEEAQRAGEDVIITYSDIWVEKEAVQKLAKIHGDFVALVDVAWEHHYQGRTDHPFGEAEIAIFDSSQHMQKIGKHLEEAKATGKPHGEFIGMWKSSPQGIKILLERFDAINKTHQLTDPFQKAKEWQKAYITDMLQELIDAGMKIKCALIEGGWNEFDTVQDFLNAGGEVPEGVVL